MAKNSKWRLSKTLSRKTEFRPIEEEDLKYAWAAYRTSGIDGLEEGLEPDDFRDALGSLIADRYDAAWVLLAETQKGFVPAGIALGFWPHSEATQMMCLDKFIWFPWGSDRNRLEATIAFINGIREEVPVMGFATKQYKKFWETVAKHGIVNRVGTSHNIYPGERVSLWETRRV